jgi:transcriptional regulator MraZ
MWGIVCNRGCIVGESGVPSRVRAGVEGLLPLLHLGSSSFDASTTVAFRGSFDYTLDAKNRLTIPAKFRATFASGVVLSLQHDAQSCISVWQPEEFERYTATLLGGFHPMSEEFAAVNRFYNSHSQDTELDAAGRVMIPAKMLEQTGLGKDVVVNGAGPRLEVWDRRAWGEESPSLAATVKRITTQLGHSA